jgi:hypothetical protein
MKLRYFLLDIKYGIENIFIWFPIIWRDRDWDHYYLLKIMNKKFERMEKLHREYSYAVCSDRTAKELKIAKLLTKRLMESKYYCNAIAPVEQKYGELKVTFGTSEKGNRTMVFEEPPEERKARLKARDHSNNMEKQDITFLCNLIRKKLLYWWD